MFSGWRGMRQKDNVPSSHRKWEDCIFCQHLMDLLKDCRKCKRREYSEFTQHENIQKLQQEQQASLFLAMNNLTCISLLYAGVTISQCAIVSLWHSQPPTPNSLGQRIAPSLAHCDKYKAGQLRRGEKYLYFRENVHLSL